MNTIQQSIQSRLNVTASEATLMDDAVPIGNLSPKLRTALKQLDAVSNGIGLVRYRLLNGAAVAVQLRIHCELVDKKAVYSYDGLRMLSSASIVAISGVLSSVKSPFVEAAWFVDYQKLEISLVCPLSHADILFSVL